ncbi:hypothetical protein CN116_16560 [Sinorhizobium meliloti]|nr:hypothetical protein CN125_26915 [Sinorhizobium meliloti]RVM43828.1 hypothetical protein CN121_22855 [Sinorhizobium meliloti]RVM59905.1 hypothetical protein CN124_27030 [Sinorhizobium meliloti]RVM66134.1 hypothetical protein CN123_18555 [Sinorhizobium meliloti]RVM76868.1 hypothetical protein CN117_30905 [Sinorhizobium meliloti]
MLHVSGSTAIRRHAAGAGGVMPAFACLFVSRPSQEVRPFRRRAYARAEPLRIRECVPIADEECSGIKGLERP